MISYQPAYPGRTAADKRKAVEIALVKFPEKTQEQVAKHVGCSQRYVSTVQDELRSNSKLTLPATRKGKDGKSRPTQYKRKAKSEPQAEPARQEPEVPGP